MSSFPGRLKELRKKNSVTQTHLATVVGITDRTCRKYETGEIEPTSSKIQSLANYFQVSTDYLLDLTDNPERLYITIAY